jgi:hypothetical protein
MKELQEHSNILFAKDAFYEYKKIKNWEEEISIIEDLDQNRLEIKDQGIDQIYIETLEEYITILKGSIYKRHEAYILLSETLELILNTIDSLPEKSGKAILKKILKKTRKNVKPKNK